ncbi:RHS repeat-associated core domain-containing protein, partial [Gelidibacter sp. F63206]|uniref:RHS repeat domain-containing protein n=1 Tax=Gelidibacter sp. F63206 TaxID=2926425 RepID=UPI00293E154E
PSLSLVPGALGYYGQGELYKTVTRDENWTNGKAHTAEEFTDKQGRVVLKRTYGDSKVGSVIVPNAPHDTYYVYDDYGNLTYVLPPKMEASTSPWATVNAQLDELGYQYTYDHRNRLVEKKIPGKDREYIVYNKLDQPILTQDANLRAQDKWLFTKYDAFGRVAYTGEMTRGIGRAALQDDADLRNPQFVTKRTSDTTMVGATIYYNNESYPVNFITEILTINYYDNYTFDGFVAMPATHDGQNILNHDNSPGTQKWTKGLATGSKVRVLDQVPAKWITTYTGYDTKGSPIYVKSVNDYLVTTDVVISTLDFTGAVEKTKSWHTKDNTTIETEDTFTYDHMGRLKKQTQELVGMKPTEVIVENTYDDLGQLTGKGVGGKTTQGRLQNVSFAYNIRGWLKQINDVENLGNNLFGFKMNYNNNAEGSAIAPALYNGNISQTIWRTANDNTKRASAYRYDALNRITSGYFRKADANGALEQDAGRYDLYGVVYDKNGNIASLKRNGHTAVDAARIVTDYGVMDDLTYDYQPNSNKLMKVTDAALNTSGIGEFNDLNKVGNDYAYDANGNMVKDLNKEIGTSDVNGITYNYLNLPTEVKFSDSNTRKINYIYDATGNKLEKKVTEGIEITRTYYAGNYVYQGSLLKFFNQPEGYVDAENGFDYVYQYKDHLGNVRLSYSDLDLNGAIDPNTEILEENNYYPGGLKHKGYNNVINGTDHPYGFNGKEESNELGLNTLDFGARNYMPDLVRWGNIDPHAESYYSLSPYTAMANNPINFIDPDGMDILFWKYDEKNKEWNQVGFDALDKDVQKSLVAFAKTDEGYSFLSDFANEGDKIGDVEFGKDGKYAKHELSYGQRSKWYVGNGSSDYQIKNGKVVLEWTINTKVEDKTTEGMAITNGHEAFIHFEQYVDELIEAFEAGDKARLREIQKERNAVTPRGREGGANEHDGYLDQDSKYSRMRSYLSQLKHIMNPAQVRKAQQGHDENLKNWRGN